MPMYTIVLYKMIQSRKTTKQPKALRRTPFLLTRVKTCV